MRFWNVAACVLMCSAGVAKGQTAAKAATVTAGPVKAVAAKNGVGLTIYNQDFAEVRTPMEVELKAGMTEVSATNVTAEVEPDSVVLRDTVGKTPIRIVEQSYDGSLRVQAQMLAKFEGKTIDFVVGTGDQMKVVQGKIVRAGAVPQFDLIERYGQNSFYQMNQGPLQTEPLIEVDGKLRYGLPGTPLFPAGADGLTLKPTLRWTIASDKARSVEAELDYMTRGLRWNATYNVIAPAEDGAGGQKLEMVGWVNVTNESGTDFHDASVQLMAGDISKLVNGNNGFPMGFQEMGGGVAFVMAGRAGVPDPITQRNFDEYHLYDLHRTTDLMDHQSKQIEFLNVGDITAKRVYVYDGFKVDGQQNGGYRYLQWNQEDFGGGTSTNKKVWVMQEFKNSEANHLGIPLPKGKMRFYRRDADGTVQFIGENTIDHTPKDETVSVFLGDAFDVTGDRTRMDFKTKQNGDQRTITESYKIVLKNAKPEETKVRVVEHMYRTASWEIAKSSDDYVKRDSQTMEFEVPVPAGGEKEVTYTVVYTW